MFLLRQWNQHDGIFNMFQAMRQLNESNDVEKGQIAIKHLGIAK